MDAPPCPSVPKEEANVSDAEEQVPGKCSEDHEKAAVHHDRAAEQHARLPRCIRRRCGHGREHARQAAIHGQRAQDSCRRALEREGEENDQYGANAKRCISINAMRSERR